MYFDLRSAADKLFKYIPAKNTVFNVHFRFKTQQRKLDKTIASASLFLGFLFVDCIIVFASFAAGESSHR